MADLSAARVELNGAPATAEDLRHLVTTNYGHFSALRVSDRGVRGLDLHLDRIEAATQELFAAAIGRERVRECLRHAIGSRDGEWSVRVNVFSRTFNRDRPIDPAPPDILITVAPAALPADSPLRVKSFAFTRALAHVKHVGTFPLFHYRRLAQQDGFDDALFADQTGAVEEGSIWNVGFFDGSGIVWPDAPHLTGVSMRLLQAGLERDGIGSAMRRVRLADLREFRSAFFTNSSTAVRLISRIDDVEFIIDRELQARLLDCHDGNPLQAL